MLKHYILDADNHAVEEPDLMKWAHWFETGNRIVGYTQINSEVWVSTIFLGLDHRFFRKGPSILFETLVFGSPFDQQMQRYSSYDDAEIGHASWVKKVRAAIGQKVT